MRFTFFRRSAVLTLATALVVVCVPATAHALPTSCTGYGPATKIRAGETREMLVSCTAAGQPATVEIVTPFSSLTAVYKGQRSGANVYDVSAPAGFTGPDMISFQGRDGDGVGGLTEHRITVRDASANELPVCSTRGSEPLVSDSGAPTYAMLTCKDPDVDSYVLEIAGAPAHGVAEVLPVTQHLVDDQPHSVRYTPAPGYVGADTFTVRVRDALGGVSPAYPFTVTTRGPADPPESDPVLKALGMTLGTLPKLGVALRRGMAVKVRAHRTGTLRVSLRVDGTTARRLGLTREQRALTIATASRTVRSGATASVRVTFTALAKRKLRRAKLVRATLIGQIGQSAATRQSVTLRG